MAEQKSSLYVFWVGYLATKKSFSLSWLETAFVQFVFGHEWISQVAKKEGSKALSSLLGAIGTTASRGGERKRRSKLDAEEAASMKCQ